MSFCENQLSETKKSKVTNKDFYDTLFCMSYVIVGLGNPKEEYKETRHNVGEMAVSYLREAWDFPDWEMDGRLNSLVSKGKLPKLGEVFLVLPQMYMNNSGKTLKGIVTSKKKAAEELVVIHDELDVPFGTVKISFNKSAGGHRGVQNIVSQIKTEEFARIRIGISGETKKGIKKPEGEKGND